MLFNLRKFEKRFIAQARCPEGDAAATPDPAKPGAKGAEGDPAATIADLQRQIAELKAAKAPPKPEEDELRDKARKERETQEQTSEQTKKIEAALKFSMRSDEFIKQNGAILPKDAEDIFRLAEKETYSSPIEKDAVIKSNLIQSFFSVQSNVDLLTAGQKTSLDDYLKLTKNGKQDKAQALYDMVFEPAFEMLKRIKKAEALSKGYGTGSDAESAYKNKLMASSKKHYLGEK